MSRALKRLPVLPAWQPLPGVPAMRSDCVGGIRPCPYVRCKWHLAIEHGSERPGRRWNGRSPPSTARATWLEGLDSCVLDVADRVAAGGSLTIMQLAAMLGINRTRTIWILRMALIKLRAQGIDTDFLSEPVRPRGTLVIDE